MTAAPRISVVIPCYNAEAWMARAIRSALDQPGVAAEVIVIDDGSTDGSLEVIRGFGDRIRWETGSNRGACAARNRGLELAMADYVMFLDADDHLEGPFLNSAVQAMDSESAHLGFGPILVKDARRTQRFGPFSFIDWKDAIHVMLEKHFIPPCGTVWLKSFLSEAGGWRVGLRRNQDYELVLRALSLRPKISSWSEGHGIYNQHAGPGRISAQNDLKTFEDQEKVVRDIRGYLLNCGFGPADASRLLERRVGQLLRSAAGIGTDEMYDRARALAREFREAQRVNGAPAPILDRFRFSVGPSRRHDSAAHVAGAWLLGLRRKERLSRWLHAQCRRLFDGRLS